MSLNLKWILIVLVAAIAIFATVSKKAVKGTGIRANTIFKVGGCIKSDEFGVIYKITGTAKGKTLSKIVSSDKYPSNERYAVGQSRLFSLNENPDKLYPVACPDKQGKAINTSSTCEEKCEAYSKELCKSLIESYSLCDSSKTEKDCNGFVTAFSKTLPKNVECINTCGKAPSHRSISYLCNEIDTRGYPKIEERSAHLLSQLQFSSAKKLFLSEDFENILDGALAQDLRPILSKAKEDK